ncbi:uncharacterized protein SCHCODRAFT_02517410 [Schizophyllum commune H4-8]|nr:uncharacterized protein SCHCODRAFT_02517410 [Schizophyllum commune H4-8]KAI5886309.1 hypothetical protein SCHCODRAFT_02517410 [Schizophyllum commune H4-8]
MATAQDGTQAEAPVQRQSERFFSTDGDAVVFRSSDKVLFNIHHTNLRAVTDGPFAEYFPSTPADAADLTEDSQVLDIMFQFVYPGNLPLLDGVTPELLFSVAEAAEKYRVAPAMALCHLQIRRISDITEDCVLQKMAYAHRHGYIKYMDQVAPLSFPKRMEDALKAFGPGLLYVAWTTYKDAWTRIFAEGTYALRTRDNHGLPNVRCDVWAALLFAVERDLGEHRTQWFDSLSTLFFDKESLADRCQHRHPSGVTHCRHQFMEWKTEAMKLAKAIPPLSQFVTAVNSC